MEFIQSPEFYYISSLITVIDFDTGECTCSSVDDYLSVLISYHYTVDFWTVYIGQQEQQHDKDNKNNRRVHFFLRGPDLAMVSTLLDAIDSHNSSNSNNNKEGRRMVSWHQYPGGIKFDLVNRHGIRYNMGYNYDNDYEYEYYEKEKDSILYI